MAAGPVFLVGDFGPSTQLDAHMLGFKYTGPHPGPLGLGKMAEFGSQQPEGGKMATCYDSVYTGPDSAGKRPKSE